MRSKIRLNPWGRPKLNAAWLQHQLSNLDVECHVRPLNSLDCLLKDLVDEEFGHLWGFDVSSIRDLDPIELRSS